MNPFWGESFDFGCQAPQERELAMESDAQDSGHRPDRGNSARWEAVLSEGSREAVTGDRGDLTEHCFGDGGTGATRCTDIALTRSEFWRQWLQKPPMNVAPLTCMGHVPLHRAWDAPLKSQGGTVQHMH